MPEVYQYEIPPFTFGPLRHEKFKYNCEKAASDFYDRYRGQMRNTWAIERANQKARVLNIIPIREKVLNSPNYGQSQPSWTTKAWASLVNAYFSGQNKLLFDRFWTELMSAQDALLVLGAPSIDPRHLRHLIQNHNVAVFLNFGLTRSGFVAPTGMGIQSIDLANAHERIPHLQRELKELYNFNGFENSPLHNSIKLYAAFVARARRHQINDHPDEAFLHFVIALELIFGERQAIQKSVSERVALITFQKVGRSFEEQRKWIDQVYDMRSRYVHGGTKLNNYSIVTELHEICAEVFRSLLRLQSAPQSQASKEALSRWLQLLDYHAKGLIAGRVLQADQLKESFIE